MKIRGFYKLTPHFPMPVIPLFSDGDLDGHFIQIAPNPEGKVSAFIKVQLEQCRVLQSAFQTIEVEIGDLAIFGFAYDEMSVQIGTAESLRANLGSKINILDRSGADFLTLDLALQLKNEELIVSTASRCISKLELYSDNLAKNWLAGALIPAHLKKKIELLISADDRNSTEKKERTSRFGFKGPESAISAMSNYARKELGIDLKSTIQSHFEEYSLAVTVPLILDHISDTISALLSAYGDMTEANETYNFFPIRSTRSSVYLRLLDKSQREPIIRSFRSELLNCRLYSAYSKSPMFSNGIEHLNFLMILSTFVRQFPDFADYLKSFEINSKLYN